MFNKRALMMASAMLMAGMGAAMPMQPAPTVQANQPTRAKRNLFGNGYTMPERQWGYSRAGQTMAQQQRASRKAKNVRRNRAAHRG